MNNKVNQPFPHFTLDPPKLFIHNPEMQSIFHSRNHDEMKRALDELEQLSHSFLHLTAILKTKTIPNPIDKSNMEEDPVINQNQVIENTGGNSLRIIEMSNEILKDILTKQFQKKS